jgi:hypothetical protein
LGTVPNKPNPTPSQPNLDQAKFDLEKDRVEEDLKIRRDELELKRRDSAKSAWSSPLLIAIIGLSTTIIVSIVQNYYQSKASRDIESRKSEANSNLERQKFEAALIQKALESGSQREAQQRFQSYLDLGLIKDESILAQIKKYVASPGGIPVQPQTAVRIDDNYKGLARRAAKLSPGTGPIQSFGDLKDLIASLPPDAKMLSRASPVTNDPNSARVTEEQGNVHVRAFLYAAIREASNDFHLIVGRAPGSQPEMYMIMVISGLPPGTSPAFAQLSAARAAFAKFFGNNLPDAIYSFYQPPIPVEVEGSLFFNVARANGPKPGPQSLKSHMPTVWEVHPITKIIFEP